MKKCDVERERSYRKSKLIEIYCFIILANIAKLRSFSIWKQLKVKF